LRIAKKFDITQVVDQYEHLFSSMLAFANTKRSQRNRV
jgi:hypothetical protein